MTVCFWVFGGCVSTEQKKVLYVNSYHKGYAPSDEVTKVILKAFDSASYHLEVVYFDAKRNGSEEYARQKANEIIALIERSDPDAIILSDDNAVKQLTPYLKTKEQLPVVFCGVNWSCEAYGLPMAHITGMLEVLPIEGLLKQMKELYPECKKLTIISENSLSEQNNTRLLASLYQALELEVNYALVDDFEEWKKAFETANMQADLIYLPTNGAIKSWNVDVAKDFVMQHIRKPVVTCDDFMMPYCVYGMTKVAAEQGEYAVATIKQVLAGRNIQNITVTKNQKSVRWINHRLASKISFRIDEEYLRVLEP